MNKDHSISSYLFGWFAMLFGSLTLSEWTMVIGMLATILGLIITWYYKHLDFKLKERQVERREKKNESKSKK